MANLGIGLLIVVVLGLLLALGGWKLWNYVQESGAEDDSPPIFFPAWNPDTPLPARTPSTDGAPAGETDLRGPPDAEEGDGSQSSPDAQPSVGAQPGRSGAAPHAPPVGPPAATAGSKVDGRGAPPSGPTGPPAFSDGSDPASETVDAGEVRFHRPLDGTLQLLPGKLSIVSGEGVGEEIRFVRIPTVKPQITFGRNPGPPHQHIQLTSPTVSRMHARFDFSGGRWALRNLSRTNPTTVNGRPLEVESDPVVLNDGDRLEMGEIAFVFHQKEGRDRLPFRSSWYTDRGRRAANQDAVLVRTLPDGRELAVVCDGMGSHSAGGVASHMALESLTDALRGGATLGDAVVRANTTLREDAKRDSDREGMATTMVAMLRDGDAYSLANVGDSRAYRVEAGRIQQITRDHSFAAEAVRAGELTSEEAAKSPWKHAVTRMLGSEDQVEVDLFGPFSAEDPHLVLLCSDGVHGVFPDPDLLERILSVSDIAELAKDLGEEALRRGSKDNVGVAVIAFAGGPARVPSQVS